MFAASDAACDPGSSYRSFILLRKLAIFRDMEPACLEEVSSRLQAVTVPAGGWVIRAGEAGDAMYFINHGAVSVSVSGGWVGVGAAMLVPPNPMLVG